MCNPHIIKKKETTVSHRINRSLFDSHYTDKALPYSSLRTYIMYTHSQMSAKIFITRPLVNPRHVPSRLEWCVYNLSSLREPAGRRKNYHRSTEPEAA